MACNSSGLCTLYQDKVWEAARATSPDKGGLAGERAFYRGVEEKKRSDPAPKAPKGPVLNTFTRGNRSALERIHMDTPPHANTEEHDHDEGCTS